MKKLLIAIALVLMFFDINAQNADTIQWMSFEQVKNAFYKKPKPILIYIYSQRCDSCKLMDSTTFANPEVVKYINVLFYPVKLNAQATDTLEFFNGQKFVRLPGSKYHGLVKTLLGDSIALPALVVFDKKAQGQVFYGYKDRDHIFPILVYYAEEVYLTTRYDQWEELYFKTYPPGRQQVISRLYVHWTPIEQIDSLMKQKPKKVLIDVYDRYKVSATIMRLRAYNNPFIAKYLNSHFYVTTAEARWKDTVVFNGRAYPPSEKYPYHTLAIDLLGGVMKFPAFVILDTNYKMLDVEKVFLTPGDFYKIVSYFGGDYYKTMSFKQYLEQNKEQLDKAIGQIRQYNKIKKK